MIKETIEIWADSFHEGEWCCDNISKYAEEKGCACTKTYEYGFMPVYLIKNEKYEIRFEVYGSYLSWDNIPESIQKLIDMGKPDFVAYSDSRKEIIFAVEETSATMTGNQPLQRCERQYGSAKEGIPFWYLVSEYGVHLDGGVRRDSIWPTVSALKLSAYYHIPNIVLHYSAESSPEDYNEGKGIHLLFSSLFEFVSAFVLKVPKENLVGVLEKQYNEMLLFVNSQWENQIDFIPSRKELTNKNTARILAYLALIGKTVGKEDELESFLQWPLTEEVPDDYKDNWHSSELLTYNKLSEQLELDIDRGNCYILSNNSGSGRPPKEQQVEQFLIKQTESFNKAAPLVPPASYELTLDSFSKTNNGYYHMTTSKNILYLYDSWSKLKESIYKVFDRLNGRLDDISEEPTVVYISNSLCPGRFLGDPFAGQLTAYSIIFSRLDKKRRKIIYYCPHQSYTYYFNAGGKGKRLLAEIADYVLFAGGVMINTSTGEVI